MKVICILLLFLAVFSCQKKSSNRQELSNLNGTWINSNYLTELKEKKSALAAYRTYRSSGVSLLEISGDSLSRHCILTRDAHNAGIHHLITKATASDLTLNVGDPMHIYYTIKVNHVGDSLLMLHDVERKAELHFERISVSTLPDPFSRAADIYLFAGKYKVLDSLGDEIYSNVNLEADGSVTNFGELKRYQIWVDYAADPADKPRDWITFDTESFEYLFKGRNFQLYARTGNSDDDAFHGYLKYTFIRE